MPDASSTANVANPPPPHQVLFDEAVIHTRVAELAREIAPALQGDWTVVVLLQGAIPFATDLMRALAREGCHPLQDGLWLESYRDARKSTGRVEVRADISRSIEGRGALIVDDVFDTGRTIAYARTHLVAKGATATRACCLVRKPPAMALPIEHVGFDAPDLFLLGYGMDVAGRYRGLPYIGTVTG
jgi:hypoxanthine phosphoribosyltransferase